ncbi:AAA family ATPase [Coraliomargarita sp. W4R53]
MDPIYLSRVNISNFRTYGKNCSIDLPERPGLTVLCGMNGLGKTAFFDAIEWALIGNIQRFSDIKAPKGQRNPLTREGAESNSHRVELHWGNQSLIRSSQDTPDQKALTNLLQNPQWDPKINDLAVYFRLTHFLSQRAKERFLQKDKKVAWDILEGPAGVERILRLRDLLNDGKARKAFERHIFRLEQLKLEATEKMDQWQKLLSEQKRWGDIAAATTAISPEKLKQILHELELSIPLPGTNLLTNEPTHILAKLRAASEASSLSLRKRHQELKDFENSASRYVQLTQQIRTLHDTQGSAQKGIEEIRIKQELVQVETARLTKQLAETEAEKKTADQQAITALILIDTESSRIAALKLREHLEGSVDNSTKKIEDLNLRSVVYRNQQESYVHAANGLKMARENLVELAESEQAFASLTEEIKTYQSSKEERSNINERQKSLINRNSTLENTKLELRARINEVSESLKKEQLSVNEGQRALGEIIKSLREEDTVCPVCAITHPQGELLKRAQDSIDRYGNRSADLVQEFQKLQSEADNISRLQSRCVSDLTEANEILNAYNKKAEEIEKLKQSLIQRSGFTDTNLDTIPYFIKERRSDLLKKEEDFCAKVNKLRISDEQALESLQNDDNIKKIRADLLESQVKLDQIKNSLQEYQAKLTTASEFIEACGGFNLLPNYRSECLIKVANYESKIENLRVELHDQNTKQQNINQSLFEKKSKVEGDKKRLDELQQESTRLTSTWHELSLDGEPNESARQEAILILEKKVRENESLMERITKTVKGVEAWELQTQMQSLQSDIAETIKANGANSKKECSIILEKQIETQTIELDHALSAQGRAREAGASLTALATKFSASALEPLSAKISDFNRMISPFPYEFILNSHVTQTRKTQTRSKIAIPCVSSGKILEREPELWLSEGQMSAMGLSVLLGASTVYRWSRWRALLLDDPLQDTDLIHAAAFGDVVRGLISDEGYQVILSTHSHDEADFLIRKCRRADLPVRKIELLSLGPSGLKYNCRDC